MCIRDRDCIDGNPKNMNMRQLWHTNKDNLSLESNGETVDTEQLLSLIHI